MQNHLNSANLNGILLETNTHIWLDSTDVQCTNCTWNRNNAGIVGIAAASF